MFSRGLLFWLLIINLQVDVLGMTNSSGGVLKMFKALPNGWLAGWLGLELLEG